MDLCLIAQSFSWFSLSSWWAIAQVVLGLGFVIFVHELGHFLVAKACGVKCEKFYVGFDAFEIKIAGRVIIPRALWKWQWGETEYGIGIVPLGGYVKMLGQDDNPSQFEEERQRSLAGGTAAPTSEREAAGPDTLDRTQHDPRSYLAKSVPQRMAIISAGVIFNLIFAVIFATLAFRNGVTYSPPVVGTTIPGGPAWEANLQGAVILRVGETRLDEGYATFIDMAQESVLHGDGKPLEIEYRLTSDAPDSASRVVTVTPRRGVIPHIPLPLIGVEQMSIPRLNVSAATRPWSIASQAEPALKPGDVVVRIDGEPVTDLIDMMRAMAPRFDAPLKLEVERKTKDDTQHLTVMVSPQPMMDLGFSCEWGEINAVQASSPAAAAGLQVGDRLVRWNGEAVGDLITLDQRIVRALREGTSEMSFEVERPNGNGGAQSVTLTVAPRMPTVNTQYSDQAFPLNTLGVTVATSRRVAHVDPASALGQQGLRVGDELSQLEVLPTREQKRIEGYQFARMRWNLAGEDLKYPTLFELLQFVPPDLKFTLTIQGSDGEKRRMEFHAVPSNTFYLQQRGFMLTALELPYPSSSWRQSLAFGWKQTVQETGRIVRILRRLVTGEISVTNLGGPGTIVIAATSEASAGTSRLLLFLTLLSANLAVINFLPIPVLDGGHMVFLLYEGIFRRPVTPQIQNALTYFGLAFILCLMMFVIFLDISRISAWFF